MDVVNLYKNAAYLENFEFTSLWYDIVKNEAELKSFLSDRNRNLATNVSIYLDDIRKVIAELEYIDEELTVKISIHKCNFNVKPVTLKTGVNTKMLFILRSISESGPNWYVYGFADCRIKSRRNLSMNKDDELGYTSHISISEISGADSGSFKRKLSIFEELRNKRAEIEVELKKTT